MTDAATSRRMSAQRRRDTEVEMSLRRLLHARGLRYRVNAPIPGFPRRRADVTFTAKQVAVFVDGCFWHGCPQHGTQPKANEAWWAEKLRGNVARDRETDQHLRELGWIVIRIWEHEDAASAADRVEAVVRSR
ncbi:very short patch repair endonuclease [Flindersiella endophytica]